MRGVQGILLENNGPCYLSENCYFTPPQIRWLALKYNFLTNLSLNRNQMNALKQPQALYTGYHHFSQLHLAQRLGDMPEQNPRRGYFG